MSIGLDEDQIECMVLEEILELHPEHLTIPELVLRMAVDRHRAAENEVKHAIRDLKRSGLLRFIGDVVAPTHPARRAGALLAGIGS